jgi:hypothetical protein
LKEKGRIKARSTGLRARSKRNIIIVEDIIVLDPLPSATCPKPSALTFLSQERRCNYAKVKISATDLMACEMIYQEKQIKILN